MASTFPAPIQSLDEIDRLIRAAIVEKVPVRAVYDGRLRVLCPHILGRNKQGRVRVLCLQVGGESVSGLERTDGIGGWRCLALEKFSNVAQAKQPWQTAGGSRRRPKCMDQIELAVADQPERELPQ